MLSLGAHNTPLMLVTQPAASSLGRPLPSRDLTSLSLDKGLQLRSWAPYEELKGLSPYTQGQWEIKAPVLQRESIASVKLLEKVPWCRQGLCPGLWSPLEVVSLCKQPISLGGCNRIGPLPTHVDPGLELQGANPSQSFTMGALLGLLGAGVVSAFCGWCEYFSSGHGGEGLSWCPLLCATEGRCQMGVPGRGWHLPI